MTYNETTNGLSGLTALSSGAVPTGTLSVSPDGTQILFSRFTSETTARPYVLTIATGFYAELVNSFRSPPDTAFYFPLGTSLVVSRACSNVPGCSSGGAELVITDSTGTQTFRLTNDARVQTRPDVSSIESTAIDISPFTTSVP